ncbi:MAG: hypothetical protein IIB03_10435, partial [Acidobacteria bacterium]|nr:hypothetical protein [Acidobacteriota bacterium]
MLQQAIYQTTSPVTVLTTTDDTVFGSNVLVTSNAGAEGAWTNVTTTPRWQLFASGGLRELIRGGSGRKRSAMKRQLSLFVLATFLVCGTASAST